MHKTLQNLSKLSFRPKYLVHRPPQVKICWMKYTVNEQKILTAEQQTDFESQGSCTATKVQRYGGIFFITL